MEVFTIEIKVIIIRKVIIVIAVVFVGDVMAVQEDFKTVEIKEKMEIFHDEVVAVAPGAVLRIPYSCLFISYFFVFRWFSWCSWWCSRSYTIKF
jgi:hypothetical protein